MFPVRPGNPGALSEMNSTCDVIDHLIERQAPEREMRESWRCLRGDGDRHRGADDPVWQGAPFVELSGSGTAYIRLFATVQWDRRNLHLTRQDWKTGAADATWDLPLDDATLELLRGLPWPEPGDGPWF